MEPKCIATLWLGASESVLYTDMPFVQSFHRRFYCELTHLCNIIVNLLGTFFVGIAIFVCQDAAILHALLVCILFSLLYARFTLPILGDVSAAVVQCSRVMVITIQLALVNLQYSPKEIFDFDKNACIRSC